MILVTKSILTICVIQAATSQENQPFPWLVLLLGLQIAAGIILLVVWTIRLVKRGRTLAEKQPLTTIQQNVTGNEENTAPDPHLLKLAKDYLIPILDYNTMLGGGWPRKLKLSSNVMCWEKPGGGTRWRSASRSHHVF